ncbi:MAG: BatD family protein [Balneolaceae bacterium]
MKPLLLLMILLGCFVNSAFSQDLTLETTVSDTKIFTGEQFSLSIQVKSSSSHNMALPALPDFNGARVLSPTPSRSTSVSIVNGQTTRTTTYTYSLIALDAGNYTIPSIDITVDDEVLQTDPIRIEVIEKGTLSDERDSQLPDIFVQVELNDENPVAGQQLIASIVLYFKENVEITSYQPAFGWRTDSFWKEEIENVTQPRAESTIKNGVRYRMVTLLRYGLFPSRSGELTLSEYELNAGIRSQARRNDPFGSFFGGAGTNQRRVTLESEPVTIQVRPLPEREESISMNAVGDFEVTRSVDKTQIVSGETIEIITTIEGEGNVPLIQRPEYNFPDGFDQFNPQESSDVERRGMNITGEKRFTELLVSRAPGNYQIPEERVAVFDPSANRYRYTTLSAIDFEVTPAPSQNVASSGSDVAVQPITGLAIWHNENTARFYHSAWFWIFLILPGIALLFSWRKKILIDKLLNDTAFRRYHTSYSTAQKRLDGAKTFLEQDQPKQVYRELHKAITGFITDKLQLAEAGLTDQELITSIQAQSVNGEITKPLKSLLEKCNTISYAPAGSKKDIAEDIKKTEQLLEQLKQKL